MMTSSPCFQSAGVETENFEVSWMESRTRRISWKLRPVLCGYVSMALIFLSGPIQNTERTVTESDALGWIMP